MSTHSVILVLALAATTLGAGTQTANAQQPLPPGVYGVQYKFTADGSNIVDASGVLNQNNVFQFNWVFDPTKFANNLTPASVTLTAIDGTPFQAFPTSITKQGKVTVYSPTSRELIVSGVTYNVGFDNNRGPRFGKMRVSVYDINKNFIWSNDFNCQFSP